MHSRLLKTAHLSFTKKSDVFGEKIGNYFLLWNVGPSWKHFGRANTVWNVDVNSSHFSNFEWIITWVRISKIIELCGECCYFFAFSFQAHSYLSYLIISYIRPGGRCKILGVLMTFCSALRINLEILGVLNACFPPIFRDIGGAIAPPAPPVPPALIVDNIQN